MNGLQEFHAPKAESRLTGKFIAGVVVVLAFGALGVWTYEKGMWNTGPKPIVPNSQLPSPSPPVMPSR
jgi:hypothetical protein